MAALIPNIAKGRLARYCDLPAANDALVWIIWTGSETDDNCRDADHVAALEATALNEATFTGYSRITAASVTVVVDDTNNRTDMDAADPVWSPTSSQATTRISLNYDEDTGSGTDSDIVPVFIDDFVSGGQTSGTLTYQVADGGFARAQ